MVAVVERYGYDERSARWRDARTGQFVAEDWVLHEVDVHIRASSGTLRVLTQRYYAGQISLEDWKMACAEELKDMHLAFGALGAGGRANMDFEKYGRIGGHLGDEYRWLQEFAEGIAAGDVSEAQALDRIGQYASAARQAYWHEWKEAVPKGELIDWVLGATETHCTSKDGLIGCVELAAGSPYKPGELKQVPGDGKTPCHGKCGCELRRAE